MAKVKIQGNASGTGVLTVTAPNTNTDRTITLPDATGELLSTAGGTMTGDLTLNGADIVKSGSADLTIDSGGRIDLSADDNGEIRLWDGSSKYAVFSDDDDRLKIKSTIQDKDILFVGNDGGVETTALKLDMSEGGLAICYGGVALGGTGTANTLDDYEEGTWTPTFTNGTKVGGNTQGNYIRVGRLCHFQYYTGGATFSNTGGSAIIGGLPFTIDSVNSAYPVFGYVHGNGVLNCSGWHGDVNGTTLYAVQNDSTGYAPFQSGTSKYIMVGGTYIIKEGS